MARDEDPVVAVPAAEAVPPTQCDPQQTQENVAVSVGEVGPAGAGVLHHGSGEENCGEDMLLDTSESDDVLDVNERRKCNGEASSKWSDQKPQVG